MRALLVCAAPAPGTARLLPGLAAEADLVVAVDGGGSVCLEAGVVPDIVVGDFDSLPADDLDRLEQRGVSVIEFPAEKDASDLELAVTEIRRRGANSVVITAASTGRLDHTLAVLAVLSSAADLRPHLVEPELDVWVLSPRGRSSIPLSGAGATISLMPFGASATVSASGCVWELFEIELDPSSSLGLSNRIGQDGRATISVSRGVVLLLAPRGPGAVRAQES
jgi:thiamine pyrophosphokinase